MKFSEWVKETREAKSLSQTECARRAGVKQPTWQEYESSDRPKERTTVEKIADALDEPRSVALVKAGFAAHPPEVDPEWNELWLRTPVNRRAKLMKATRGVQEAIASY